MTALLTPRFPHVAATRSRAVVTVDRRVLGRIHHEGYDLALWSRRLPANVSVFCGSLALREPAFVLDVTGMPGPSLLAALAANAPFDLTKVQAPARWLLGDMVDLAGEFATAGNYGEVRVRLARVADDGCAAFHVDTLPLRLLCTYVGAGTQWVEEAHGRRAELGLRNRTTEEANAAIVPDPACIRTMPTGAVAIFKGRLWPGAQNRGLIHRSHPVCCGDHARLRLVIDPAGSRTVGSRPRTEW